MPGGLPETCRRRGWPVQLRDVELTDVGAYVRMRCDPVMMAGLGGPLPREGIEAKVQRDVEQAAARAEEEARIVSVQMAELTQGLVRRLEQVEQRNEIERLASEGRITGSLGP